MLRPQQVIDGLHGVEGSEGHFHEDGAPVAHGAVPQTGQLKCLQLLAPFRLGRDEASGLVNEVGEVERLAFVVLHRTDQVHGIEVGALREHLHVFLIVGVYL